MAGTVTVTEERYGSLKKIAFAWTSSAGGAADGSTSGAYNGVVERLVTVPSGSAAPTDDYDLTIVDEDGVDVLMGAGANRDAANTEQVLASSLGVVANDTLTVHVTNAGNAKQGTVYLYLR
jgi:hypothetical protein